MDGWAQELMNAIEIGSSSVGAFNEGDLSWIDALDLEVRFGNTILLADGDPRPRGGTPC